jgi:hypothetical protein
VALHHVQSSGNFNCTYLRETLGIICRIPPSVVGVAVSLARNAADLQGQSAKRVGYIREIT